MCGEITKKAIVYSPLLLLIMHWLMDQQKTDPEAARSLWDTRAWRHSGAERTLIPGLQVPLSVFPTGGAPDNIAMLITAAQDLGILWDMLTLPAI